MTYTVWAYDYAGAPHHCNDLAADTVDNFKVAYDLARKRADETAQESGYTKVVDNSRAGHMGDNGVITVIGKTKTGLRRDFIRDDYKKLLYTRRWTRAGLLALRNPDSRVWEYYESIGPHELNIRQTGSTLAFEN